jgi:membrane-associated phospholipid phosphatase
MDWDISLFYYINGLNFPSWAESVLIEARNGSNWIPLYLFIVIFFLYRLRKEAFYVFIVAAFLVGFTDFTNSKGLKSAFKRERPCQQLTKDAIQLRVSCGSGKSFPSSHAANHMALAIFLVRMFGFCRKGRWLMLLIPWALLIGFSQIFVGVHFPFDVIAGFLYGTMTATAFHMLFKFWFPAINTRMLSKM